MVNNDIGYSNEKGKVFCNKSILLSVINLATKEISGVAALCENFGGAFKKCFSSQYYEGVRLKFDNDGIDIDVFINVFFGSSVPDIAARVQQNIKNGVASMVDVKIKKINVNVLGVAVLKSEESL